MIFLAKGLLGFCSAYGGQFTGNELYRMAIRLDTRARFPAVCGSVGTGDMTSFHSIASNCRLKVVIAGPNEILLVPDKIPETGEVAPVV
jgi:hypothetical protein